MTDTKSSTTTSIVAEQPADKSSSNHSLPEDNGSSPESELQVLLEGAATILSENGFSISDTDVQWFSDELWGVHLALGAVRQAARLASRGCQATA